jgi:histidyl-tRNA synthetase
MGGLYQTEFKIQELNYDGIWGPVIECNDGVEMAKKIQAVKGTREFYPEQMYLRNYLYEKVRAVSQAFGYQEWDAPFIESIELYAAKSGEELVKRQSFTFQDRGGEYVTLRPELTPSLARMIAARQNELVFPVRWWSFGPCWRYEQPQKGRTREFFQWNVDLLGVDTPEADAELIAVAAEFLRSVNLKPSQACIQVNDRRLMESEFNRLKLPASSRLGLSNLIDRRSKTEPAQWDNDVLELGVSQTQLSGLKELLEDFSMWEKSESLKRLFSALGSIGVSEYVSFNPSVVRGLLYYTGTVFEAFESGGSVRRSILGGGRYDRLLEDVGGKSLSAVGFAMGDVVVGIILQEAGLIPEFRASTASVLVTVYDQSSMAASLMAASELRKAGINTLVYNEPSKYPRQFKYADRMKIPIVVVLGPEEIMRRNVTIKSLNSGEQITCPAVELVERIRSMLAEGY